MRHRDQLLKRFLHTFFIETIKNRISEYKGFWHWQPTLHRTQRPSHTEWIKFHHFLLMHVPGGVVYAALDASVVWAVSAGAGPVSRVIQAPPWP